MLINQYANVPILIRLIFTIGKLAYSKIGTFICGSSSVDRALAFQAEGRGFESRLPLFENIINLLGKYQSGQMGQTVNLLAYAFGGSNPSLPTKIAEVTQLIEH